MVFAIDNNWSTNLGPSIKLGNFFCFHIDTAMTHGYTKVVVPVSAMETVSGCFGNLFVIKEHNIRDVG